MINRKCSRCKEITGTMHGGKKLRKNFYVKTVCKKELRAGKSNYHKWNKKNLVSFYKDIKNNECYLFNSINYNCFFCWSIYTRSRAWWNIFFNNRYSWCYDNWIHIPVCSCILRDMGIHPISRNSH